MTKNFRKFFELCLSPARDSTILETFPNRPNPAQWIPETDAKINARARQSRIKQSYLQNIENFHQFLRRIHDNFWLPLNCHEN